MMQIPPHGEVNPTLGTYSSAFFQQHVNILDRGMASNSSYKTVEPTVRLNPPYRRYLLTAILVRI